MPSSHPLQIGSIVSAVMKLQPSSVLDVGIGFGKYGFLLREYLELWDGREVYDKWTHRIDGIEGNRVYVTGLQRAIYDDVMIGDALTLMGSMLDNEYDLVLLIDIIEHLTPEKGKELLGLSLAAGKHLLVSTPKVALVQGAAFGNDLEIHRSQWSRSDFIEYQNVTEIADKESLICLIGSQEERHG